MKKYIDHHRSIDNFACPDCEYLFKDSCEYPEAGDDKCPECGCDFEYSKEYVTHYNTEKKEL